MNCVNYTVPNGTILQLDVQNCFDTALRYVKDAGDVVMEGYHCNKSFETKLTDWDLVTEYDKRVEQILINNLNTTYPDHKFIGEETSTKDEKLTDEPTWLIDPIDGTTNFVHSNPHSCISVALAVGSQLVLGIVFNPVLNQLFTAQKGKGAFLNDKPIHTSNVEDISNALIGFEISLARDIKIREKFFPRFQAFLTQAHGVRTLGSAALSLCYVAMGAWDAYQVDFLYCWDYSAGALIIQEAGGTVVDTSGSEFKIMNRRILATGTQKLSDQLVNTIKKADESSANAECKLNGSH